MTNKIERKNACGLFRPVQSIANITNVRKNDVRIGVRCLRSVLVVFDNQDNAEDGNDELESYYYYIYHNGVGMRWVTD